MVVIRIKPVVWAVKWLLNCVFCSRYSNVEWLWMCQQAAYFTHLQFPPRTGWQTGVDCCKIELCHKSLWVTSLCKHPHSIKMHLWIAGCLTDSRVRVVGEETALSDKYKAGTNTASVFTCCVHAVILSSTTKQLVCHSAVHHLQSPVL